MSYLEDLSSVGELAHVTEAEDGHDLLARHHGVQVAAAPHVVRYDLSSSVAEPDSHQTANAVEQVRDC